MKCQQCQSKNLTSKIEQRSYYTTLLLSNIFHDEDGREHIHNPNAKTTGYFCSKGHSWEAKYPNRCWCGWKSF